MENRNIVFLSVYAPCTPGPTFFSVLSTYLLKFSDIKIVLGADTNSVMSHILDRSGPKESHSQAFCSDKLRQCVTSSSLVNSCHLLNPFTFFSATHKSYSRIDYILISTSLSSAVRDAICSSSLSDHDGNLCRLSLIPRPSRATRWRFNPKLLQDENFCSQFRNKFAEFIEINQGSVDDPRTL